jgi:alkanesulfonate monooxygenase SsuD/methylene tetrahydromethanopterin reductase-like flavin-dependent oxidoreductase (luciferase family)
VIDLQLGLVLPTWTTGLLRFADVLDIAREAEQAGFDALWVTDHVLLPSTNEELRRRAGAVVQADVVAEPEGYLEAFTTLTALAAAIPKLELGTLVACTGYRNPVLLAKMAVTLDEISGGRFVLGLGSGDSAGEHHTMGLPTDSPVSRFEEALKIIRGLLRDGFSDLQGRFYSANEAQLVPRGPRPEGPPILIGTLNPRSRMKRIVAEYADIWNGWLAFTDASSDSARAQIVPIQAACRERNRDITTLTLTTAVRVNLPGSDMPGPGERPVSGNPEEMAMVLRDHASLGVKQVQVELSVGSREGVRAFSKVIQSLRSHN